MKRQKTERNVSIELVEERRMTEAELETLASLLFSWWKREFEQRGPEVRERRTQKELGLDILMS
jgi:hypothetical protein